MQIGLAERAALLGKQAAGFKPAQQVVHDFREAWRQIVQQVSLRAPKAAELGNTGLLLPKCDKG